MQSPKFSSTIDFQKLQRVAETGQSVVPVVVQDANTHQVLTLAYVTEGALFQSIETGIATFWSTSRNALWVKGSTSGNHLQLIEVRVNCETNSLLFRVVPLGNGVCHKTDPETHRHYNSCYFTSIWPHATPS